MLYLVPLALLIFVLDTPWLWFQSSNAQQIVRTIQGSPLQLNTFAMVPVYLFLAYLATRSNTRTEAFGLGIATYGVYDFTTLALLKDYPLWFAVADTLWGGVLFVLVHSVGHKLKLLPA